VVGISGEKDRQIQLIKDKFGNEVVIFGGWENWERYYQRYLNTLIIDRDNNEIYLTPAEQWQWKQNYPELVAEDITANKYEIALKDEIDAKSWVYADLLYRGINKWLFVRYMLIRYKKLVAEWRDEYYGLWQILKNIIANTETADMETIVKRYHLLGYFRGKFEAYRIVRADLKTLCNTPRFVVWNGSRPGFVVDKKISRGWLRLIQELYDVRFEK